VQEVARQLQRVAEPVAQNLQFMVDGETGKTVIRVFDGATKEVIRRFPTRKCWRSPGRWIGCRAASQGQGIAKTTGNKQSNMALSSPGIGSGLDVNGLVSQLMALEQRPFTFSPPRKRNTRRSYRPTAA